MSVMKLSDVIVRANTKEDRTTTSRIYFAAGEQIDPQELLVRKKGIIAEADLGPMFYFGFKAGQVLLPSRSFEAKKAAVATYDGICSEKTFVLETKDPNILLQEYLICIIQNDAFWQYAEENKSGSVNYFLNWSAIANYEFDLPSIDEQKELADKLWAAYKVKESYRQLLSTTDEMLKAKFQEMFGDVDNNKHNFPVEALGKICECYAGATPSTEKSEYWNGGTIPWMSSGEVHKKFVTYTDAFVTTEGYNHSSTKMVPIHSIVVALAGQGKTRGTVAVNEIELCTNQSLCAIVPSSTINYLYLFHNLNSRYLEIRNMAGDIAGRGGLNLKIINSIKVILPPMELQQQFAEIATQAEATKASLRASIEAIDRVIKSLINQ